MKRKLLCKLLVINALSCSEPAEDRYTQQSQETDVLRQFATHYSKGEWASIQALYADSAKIYNNQREKNSKHRKKMSTKWPPSHPIFRAADSCKNRLKRKWCKPMRAKYG